MKASASLKKIRVVLGLRCGETSKLLKVRAMETMLLENARISWVEERGNWRITGCTNKNTFWLDENKPQWRQAQPSPMFCLSYPETYETKVLDRSRLEKRQKAAVNIHTGWLNRWICKPIRSCFLASSLSQWNSPGLCFQVREICTGLAFQIECP